VQERAGNTVQAVTIGNEFLSRTQVAQQLRERIDKWDYMKLKSFCTTKEMISKLKRPPSEWEIIFISYNQNIQGAEKPKLPNNQLPNEEMGK
jgi:mitochondrial fission protein ELM1